MIGRDQLIAWLVVLRYMSRCDIERFMAPSLILRQLEAEGWMTIAWPDVDWQGDRPCGVTPAGNAVADLHDPEFGINPIPVSTQESD